METAIFHIGNAGLFFYRNGTGILIDGIYDGSKVGMSAMPEAWDGGFEAMPWNFAASRRIAFYPSASGSLSGTADGGILQSDGRAWTAAYRICTGLGSLPCRGS